MNLKGLTEEQLKKVLEYVAKEHTAYLWGQPHKITPCLISETNGDGMQLVALTPIDTRPNYYVLRIDSKIDLEDDDSLNEEDKNIYGCVSELLLQMIENEHINIGGYDENNEGKYFDPYDKSIEPFEYEFPMLSWGGGFWCRMRDFRKELSLN